MYPTDSLLTDPKSSKLMWLITTLCIYLSLFEPGVEDEKFLDDYAVGSPYSSIKLNIDKAPVFRLWLANLNLTWHNILFFSPCLVFVCPKRRRVSMFRKKIDNTLMKSVKWRRDVNIITEIVGFHPPDQGIPRRTVHFWVFLMHQRPFPASVPKNCPWHSLIQSLIEPDIRVAPPGSFNSMLVKKWKNYSHWKILATGII